MSSHAASTPQSPTSVPRSGPRIGIETTYGDRLREGAKAYQDKNYHRAAALFTSALEMKPDPKNAVLAYSGRSWSYQRLHFYSGAAADLEKVKSLAPPNAHVLNSLAWLRATAPDDSVRNGRPAVRDGIRACELTHWKETRFIDTLAAAYAEAGDFERALQWQTKAVKFARSEDRKEMEEHLAQFKAGTPIRQP